MKTNRYDDNRWKQKDTKLSGPFIKQTIHCESSFSEDHPNSRRWFLEKQLLTLNPRGEEKGIFNVTHYQKSFYSKHLAAYIFQENEEVWRFIFFSAPSLLLPAPSWL